MKTDEFREKLLNEEGVSINPLVDEIVTSYGKMFKLGEPANYEPDPKDSFESLALSSNMTAEEIAYDAMLEKEGRALIYHPLFNYPDRRFESSRKDVKTSLYNLRSWRCWSSLWSNK